MGPRKSTNIRGSLRPHYNAVQFTAQNRVSIQGQCPQARQQESASRTLYLYHGVQRPSLPSFGAGCADPTFFEWTPRTEAGRTLQRFIHVHCIYAHFALFIGYCFINCDQFFFFLSFYHSYNLSIEIFNVSFTLNTL